jgi:hypothetical protein
MVDAYSLVHPIFFLHWPRSLACAESQMATETATKEMPKTIIRCMEVFPLFNSEIARIKISEKNLSIASPRRCRLVVTDAEHKSGWAAWRHAHTAREVLTDLRPQLGTVRNMVGIRCGAFS